MRTVFIKVLGILGIVISKVVFWPILDTYVFISENVFQLFQCKKVLIWEASDFSLSATNSGN